jgi:hypothetical protein
MVQSKLPDGTWLKYDSEKPPPEILQLRAGAAGGGGGGAPPAAAPGPSAPGAGGDGGGAVVQPNVDPSMANTAPPPLDRSGAPGGGPQEPPDYSWMTPEAMGPALEGVTAGWLSEISGLIGGLMGMARGEEASAAKARTEEASNQRLEEYRKQHPVASAALELGGAGLSAAALPEVKAAEYLGVGGRVAPRVVNSAATGTTYGGIYGGGKGEGPDIAARSGDILRGAAEGLVAGPVGEGVGQALSWGARKIMAPFQRGSDRAAAGAVVGAIDKDLPNMSHAEQLQFMRDRQAEGHDFRVADIATARNVGTGQPGELAGAFKRGANVGGATTQDLARASANVSGDARNTIEDVTGPRFARQGDDFEAAIERHTGGMGQETGRGLDDRLALASKTSRKPYYDRAYEKGDVGIQMTPPIGELMSDPTFRKFMEKGRDALARSNTAARATGGQVWEHLGTAGGGVRDPTRARATLAYWDQVKREIDDAWNAAKRAGNNNEARILNDYRQALRGELIRQVPEYGDALGVAESLFGAKDAGELGSTMAARNSDAIDLRRAQAKMTPEDRAFFRANWVSHYVGQLRDTSNARNIIVNFAKSPEAKAQLEAVLGRDAAEKLMAHLQVTKMMDRMKGAVSGNSTTVRQFVQQHLPTVIGSGSLGSGGLTAAALIAHGGMDLKHLAAAGAAAGAGAVGRGLAKKAGTIRETGAKKIAELLMSDDPARYEAAINMIAHSPAILRNLERFISRGVLGAGVATPEHFDMRLNRPAATGLGWGAGGNRGGQ